MSLNLTPTFKAGGTIAPCRFVKFDTTQDHAVLQADANAVIAGVSQEGQKRAPGLPGSDTTIAAESGDDIQVRGYGVALVEAGAAITRGARVEADANGKAITSAGAGQHNIGGVALESAGGAGVRIAVYVIPMGQITI